jgi:nuclear transport factor 2 (NTF2) superfamily protein
VHFEGPLGSCRRALEEIDGEHCPELHKSHNWEQHDRIAVRFQYEWHDDSGN